MATAAAVVAAVLFAVVVLLPVVRYRDFLGALEHLHE
jgi:hypothetical protein